MLTSLFPPAVLESGVVLCAVALENSLDKTLTYEVPKAFAKRIAIGQRVKVPLGRGNKPAYGYVVGLPTSTDVPVSKLKRLLAIDDERVLIPASLMELARWMSRYYVCPLGTVLDSVIPSAVKKRIGLGFLTLAKLAISREKLQELLEGTKQAKRRAVYARLLQLPEGEEIELLKLASDSGVKIPTVRKLVKAGVIIVHTVPDLAGLAEDTTPSATVPDIQLNADQQKVFDALRPKLAGGFSTSLLMGVTGSGKTEVYLQAIRAVIEQGKQAVVLVPEIALTPQTVRRFTQRFPRVAYLHSGLSATARHRQWQTILAGKADVVVGARSAVFAPVPKLGIIVVDEEHEGSYKQDTAPRYNARDTAIKRAQLEGCPCLLGSATPALESYVRAKASDALLLLPNRVRGLSMPAVELVDMKQELKLKKSQHLISTRLEHLLKTTLEQGRQAILLLNRRGYSNFVYCSHCQEAIECKYCDATLTYHRNQNATAEQLPPEQLSNRDPKLHSKVIGAKHVNALHTGQLHCHYCLAVNPLPTTCPTCGKLLSLFGLGTQRVEEELLKKLPDVKYARVDSDTMRSGKDYEALLERFGRGEIQVMLGTQMIAKGLDYPNVTLVGVISGDTALALPDFRAAERTFQLITQVAGRAGRGDNPGRVVLQTFIPDDPTIQSALKQDYVGFAERELEQREQIPLPPYARLARIILRDDDETKLQELALKIAEGLRQAAGDSTDVQIKGPMPCAINRIAGFHRVNILLSAATPQAIQRVLATAREAKLFAQTDRIAIDIDPVSLL